MMDLKRLAKAICDEICKWPENCSTQEELDEKCANCKSVTLQIDEEKARGK